MELERCKQLLTAFLVGLTTCVGAAPQHLTSALPSHLPLWGVRQADVETANPKGWFAIPPDQIKWTKLDDGTGRAIAYLIGDPAKSGQYIFVVRWPPRTQSKAHLHTDNRYAVVLSGTFYLGHGNKFDANNLERLYSGTFYTEPVGVAHFGATKDEGAVLYYVGSGPSRTDQIEK